MASYMKSFEHEIATETLIQDIGDKISKIFKFLGDLIKKAIQFLKQFLEKIIKRKKNIKTDKTATPSDQSTAGASAMQTSSQTYTNNVSTKSQSTSQSFNQIQISSKIPESDNSFKEDIYDCGNELSKVIEDMRFCIQLLMKRPKPDYKVGKNYIARWDKDNELILDRMANSMNTLEKLEDIDKKTVTFEMGTKLKRDLEEINELYEKYGRMYDMFLRTHKSAEPFLLSTVASFTAIANTGTKALNILMKLYTPDN